MAFVSMVSIWCDRVTLFVGFVFGFSLCIILLKQLICDSTSTKKTMDIHMKTMNFFAILAISVSAFYCGIRVIGSFGIIKEDILNCSIQSLILVFAWTTAKQLLYLFCTSRMDVAFRLSAAFKMSNTIFTALYTLIIFGYVVQCILFIIFWDGTRYEFSGNEYCTSVAPIWLFGIMAIWDLTMSSLLCSLFAHRLFKAHAQMQELNSKQTRKALSNIAKYVTITLVAVISTFIALFMAGITSWYTVAAIDSMINCLCVFVMYKKNQKIFTFVCGGCHNCVGSCFNRCIKNGKNGKNTQDSFLKIYSRSSTTLQTNISESIQVNSTAPISPPISTQTAENETNICI
eukprot:447422_1